MYSGEQTLLTTRPTRLISLRYYIGTLLFLGLAGVFYLRVIPRFYQDFPSAPIGSWTTDSIAAAFFLFLAILFLLVAELRQKTTRYTITDNKIIREDGILNKKTSMVPYTQLERVELQQSFVQRILRIGTLVVDTGDDSISIDMVPRPKRIQDLLSSRLGRRAWADQQPPQTR